MNQPRKRLQRAFSSLLGRKQDKPKLIPALLGAYFNGQKTITVAKRPDFVYCRLRGATSGEIQAFNDEVAHHWDLPILVYRPSESPGQWKVWGRDTRRYESWGGDSYLPPHGRSHSFFGEEGADPVWITKRQYMPLLVHPDPTGTMSAYVEPDFYYLDGQYHWWPGSGTADLTSRKPTGSFNARYVTIYIDGSSETLDYIDGPEFNAYTPPPDPGDYITMPPLGSIPLAAAYLLTGTRLLGWNEIYDLRQPEAPPPGTGTFSPSDLPAPVIGVMGWDDGAPIGTGTTIDFGDELDVTLSGAVLRVDTNVTHPAPQIGVMGWDDGSPLGTGTTIDWGDGLDATLSGSVLHVETPDNLFNIMDWSTHHGFSTGTANPASGEISFDNTTYASVTEVRIHDTTLDGITAAFLTQDLDIAGLRVVIWSQETPTKYWAGALTVGRSYAPPVLTLGVEYIGHVGAFDEGEELIFSAAYQGHITGSVNVYDDDVLQTRAHGISFDANLDVTVSGGIAYVAGQAGGGGGGGLGVVVWDDGVFLATGTVLDFGDNLDLTASGSVVRVDAQAGGGGGALVDAVTTGTFYIETVLYEETLATATGSMVATAIPSDYDHLRVILVARGSAANENQAIGIILNADATETNYRFARHAGGSIHTVDNADRGDVGLIPGASAGDANFWGYLEAIIEQYSNEARKKTLRAETAIRSGSTNIYNWENTVNWENNAAIESIEMSTDIRNSDNFVTGTFFQVLGIKEQVLVTAVEVSAVPDVSEVSVGTGTVYVEELLYEVTLASATGSIIAPGLSQDYDHLKVRSFLRGARAATDDGVDMLMNGDATASNYRWAVDFGGTTEGGAAADIPQIGDMPAASTPAGVYGAIETEIFDYTITGTQQAVISAAGQRRSSTIIYSATHTYQWEKYEAVNRIDIVGRNDDLAAGSHVQIFGLREKVVVTSVEGGGLTSGSVDVYDDNVFQIKAWALAFQDNLDVTVSGGIAYVDGQSGGGSGDPPWISVWDSGEPQGSGVIFDFDTNLEATVSGTVIKVDAPGAAALAVSTGTIYAEEVLYEVTLESATGTIMATNLSQEYDHLRILFKGRTDEPSTDDSARLYFNGDTTPGNYRAAGKYEGTAEADFVSDSAQGPALPAANSVVGQFGPYKGLVLDYTVTGTFKTNLVEYGEHRDASSIFIRQLLVSWEDGSAINQIHLVPAVGPNFVAGTHLQIIGIREKVVVTGIEGNVTTADLAVSTGTIYAEEIIYEDRLGVTTGTFVIPGISQDYDDLKLLVLTRTDGTAGDGVFDMEFNGDGAAGNYFYGAHVASVAVHTNIEGDGQDMGVVVESSGASGDFALNRIDIPRYTDTTKNQLSQGIEATRVGLGDQRVYSWSHTWEDTSAINRIDLVAHTDNFVTGTHVRLVGVREKVVVTDVQGGVLVDGVTDFLTLDDTPSSYAGQSGTILAVNESEDAVEFVNRVPGALVQYLFATGTTDVSRATNSWADLAEMILTGTFGDNDIEIHFSFGAGNSSANGIGVFRIAMDGVAITAQTKIRTPVASLGPAGHLTFIGEVSAGEHVITGQWKTEVGTQQSRAATGVEHRQLTVKEYQR